MRRLQQPLEGIPVIDLTRYIVGPYCTAILADMGAEVIEIDRPGGDDGRRRGVQYNGENIKWHVYHRNKKTIKMLEDTGYKDRVELLGMYHPEIAAKMVLLSAPDDMAAWLKAWNEVKA